MKNWLKTNGIIFAKGAAELLFYLPVFLTAAIYLLPHASVFLWLIMLPLVYWSGAALKGIWKSSRFIVELLASCTIGYVYCYLFSIVFISSIKQEMLAALALLSALLCWKGIVLTRKGWKDSFDSRYMITGIMTYVAAQPLKVWLLVRLIEVETQLFVCGAVVLILSFYIFNGRFIKNETVDVGQSPAAIAAAKHNRMLMSLITCILLAASFLLFYKDAVMAGFRKVMAWILSWLSREPEEPVVEQQPEPTAPSQFPEVEPSEPAKWMLILEQIIKIIVIAAVAAAILLLVYAVSKKLLKLAYRLWLKFMKRSGSMEGQYGYYVDEEEQLTSIIKKRRKRRSHQGGHAKGRKNFETKWSRTTDNREKIRLLYAQWLGELARVYRYRAKSERTAQETGADLQRQYEKEQAKLQASRFIDIYDAVRYGDHVPSYEETEQLKKKILGDLDRK